MNTTRITSNRIHNIALKEVVSNSPMPKRDSAGQRTFTMGETEILNGEKAEVLALQKGIQQANANLANSVKEYDILDTDFKEKTASYEASIKAKVDEQEPIKVEIAKQEQDVAFFEKHSSPSKKSEVKTGWFKRNKNSMTIVLAILFVELAFFFITLPIQREAFSWDKIIVRFGAVAFILLSSLFMHSTFNQVKKTAKIVIGACLSITMLLGLTTVAHSLIVALTADTGSEFAFSFDFALAEAATNAANIGIKEAILNEYPGLIEAFVAALLMVICLIINKMKKGEKENTSEENKNENTDDITFFVDKAKSRLEELKGKLNANIAAIADLNNTFETTNNGYKARVKEFSEIAKQFNVDRIEATTKLDALLDEVLKSLHEYRVLFCEMYREKNCVSSVDYDMVTLEDIRNYYNL